MKLTQLLSGQTPGIRPFLEEMSGGVSAGNQFKRLHGKMWALGIAHLIWGSDTGWLANFLNFLSPLSSSVIQG